MSKSSHLILSCIFCLLSISLNSCEKDRLTGPNDIFEGEWEFSFSRYYDAANTGVFLLDKDSLNFTAALRLNNRGMIAFIENGHVIEENKFKITSQQSNTGNADIRIKIKVDDDILDINDKLRLSIINDTLIVDDYPFNGRKNIDDYAIGATSAGNFFLRK